MPRRTESRMPILVPVVLLGLGIVFVPGTLSAQTGNGPPPELAAMLASLGPAEYRASNAFVTSAACTGPRGSFTTVVASVPPDITLMHQSSERDETLLLAVGDRGWSWSEVDAEPEPLDAAGLGFVRGHEFHLALLRAPERYGDFTLVGAPTAVDPECLRLESSDSDGRSVTFCLDPSTHRPVHLEFLPPAAMGDDPIVVLPDDWTETAGLTLFRRFELRHAGDVFTYDYDMVVPAVVEPGFFARDAEPRWLLERMQDLVAVVRLHARVMDAHRRSDPDPWLDDEVANYLSVNRGRIARPTLDERTERITGYLGATSFDFYRDRVPVHVRLARDGSLAWLACEVEATGLRTGEDGIETPLDFAWAWVELLAREEDRWVRAGNASNSRE